MTIAYPTSRKQSGHCHPDRGEPWKYPLRPQHDRVLHGVMTVPMAGAVESVNVAIAGAVVLFEIARQRRSR